MAFEIVIYQRRLAPSLSVALCLCLLAACSSKNEGAASLRTVTDEYGREVRINPRPERIVSLAPSITETLYALGLGDRVVGVTTYCDYPPEAKQKEQVGDTLRPSVEKIVALKPDLVIISTASQLESFVRKLEEIKIPVYISNPRNLEGVLRSIEAIGEISGAPDRGRELSLALRARVEAIQSRVAGRGRPRVFLLLGGNPLITAGRDAFVTDMINRAGGRSISDDETADYPQYSLETAVARQPEVILLQAGEESLPQGLRQTPAALAGHVYHLDDDLLLRPGPRIVDGLEQMAAKIHPVD
ncbi:MAG TPA: cobalamin-binding protein [Blastocatellia bacterium]|nr:cobalamin-binding protein [Blastocatellia bacterium]